MSDNTEKSFLNDKDYEQKFIVINMKHIRELNVEATRCGCREAFCGCTYKTFNPYFDKIKSAIDEFLEAYEKETGKKLDKKYLVVNQDEHYIDRIWNIIKENSAL